MKIPALPWSLPCLLEVADAHYKKKAVFNCSSVVKISAPRLNGAMHGTEPICYHFVVGDKRPYPCLVMGNYDSSPFIKRGPVMAAGL